MKRKESRFSAFQAKTHLSELLRGAEQGKSYIIERHGKVVARLIPATSRKEPFNPSKIRAAFQELRSKIKGTVNVLELIEEGRRY
ncbi:MAG: type II toxin-antitoxin system prevent-host-death family antitoxin [Deltaproteobacteria bacterium]|nr:type II toxin-antitoxin system prevent-host-death family antitoxin [Deltaproteobacteria bacterium]